MSVFIHVASAKGLPVLAGAVALTGFSAWARADFFGDSHAFFETRNVYFNRDFRDGPSSLQSRRDEWAQGLMLKLESGYTPGVVGFGVDALGMLGIRLDSSPERAGSGLLPVRSDGRAAAQYGKLGLTAKLKISATELKAGALIPSLPTLRPNDGMILPQSFEGLMLTSREFPDLVMTAGQLDKVKARNDTSYEDIALNNKNNRFTRNAPGGQLDLAGFDRKQGDDLKFSYHYAGLSDVYRQHFLGLIASRPLASGTLNADLRFFASEDQGAARGGKIDNQALNGLFGYGQGGHKVSLGYQRMSGASAFPYIEGSDAYLVNFAQIGDFAEAKERSWQARYDYDFESMGIPGLTFMSRYISGDHAQVPGVSGRGQEWERNTEVRYMIQSGAFKNLALRLRNATYRSSFSRDADETRILLTYTKALW
ncbi:OprD family porin [Pseudomonas gingeri]|uniref:OprD family porin n=1 Tax=Pseudomonas gingeri TaxID=117681 RepID=A0A7Y7WVV0_9PSED|nr:OprD family porin [Pseudomonas gingeri]